MSHTDVRQHPALISQFFLYSDSLGLAGSPQLSHQHKLLLDDTWQEQQILS